MKKTNKNFKRFAAITSASLLAACAVAPAAFNAYAQKVNISLGEGVFNGDTIEHNFNYVQILLGESETKSTGIELKNPSWNTDNIDVVELIKDLAEDDTFIVNEQNPFADAQGNALTGMSATVFADKIKDFGEDTEKSQALAKAIFANVIDGKATAYNTELGITADGYYLITDETNVSGQYNSKGRYILTTIDGDSETPISAKLKASAPSVIKKVQEDDNAVTAIADTASTLEKKVDTSAKWNDVADYCIGEAVPFQLYGSMPSTLGDYSGYFYQFNDTLGEQFDQPEEVIVKVGATEIKYTLTGGVYTTETDKNCRVKFEAGKLTVSFENIKAYDNVTADTVVTVYYEAVLNDKANIGIPGQINTVDLSYSNNPTVEYNPKVDDETENKDENTGKTPEDKVVVFTYEADVSKYNTAGTALNGAKFVLTRTNGAATEYVLIEEDKVSGWTTDVDEAYVFTSTANVASIKIKGLDDGTYTLIEQEAPEGYKLPEGNAAKFTFTIDASTTQSQTWTGASETKIGDSVLTKIDVSVDTNNALLSKDEKNTDIISSTSGEGSEKTINWNTEKGAVGVAITNTSGTTLPGTGGIGTTIFYLGGGAMAAIGGVYLISKRRMKKSEE